MFAKIDELKQQLDALRPLPPGLVKNLRESFRIEWTVPFERHRRQYVNLAGNKAGRRRRDYHWRETA